MQSKKLQYMMPDESNTGTKNKGGIVGSYPYFGKDQGGMRKAPKMTKADALYLKKFMEAGKAADIMAEKETLKAELAKNAAARRQYQPEPFEDGKINITVNSRLYLERNKHLKPEDVLYRAPNGDKVTLTDQIFGEHRYFQQKDDSKQDKDMQKYVKENYESTVEIAPGAIGKKPASKALQNGNTGNVVPFFPTDWQLHANDVFNQILNGEKPTEDVYDEAEHAAIHHK